jgi:hypothetical protein
MKAGDRSVGVSRRLGALILGATAWAAAPIQARADGGWFGIGNRDDCAPGTRHAKGEWGLDFCRAKHLQHLDCAGLTAYSERMRFQLNQRPLMLFLGNAGAPTPATPAASTSPEPSLDPLSVPPPGPGTTPSPVPTLPPGEPPLPAPAPAPPEAPATAPSTAPAPARTPAPIPAPLR